MKYNTVGDKALGPLVYGLDWSGYTLWSGSKHKPKSPIHTKSLFVFLTGLIWIEKEADSEKTEADCDSDKTGRAILSNIKRMVISNCIGSKVLDEQEIRKRKIMKIWKL